jgi:Uma2 family endonuclease
LVLEISDSSYAYDSAEKASLYARAGIPEYWLLDLRTRRLEVRQQPGPESDAIFGHAYRLVRTLHEHDTVAACFAPEIQLLISELLPPVDL